MSLTPSVRLTLQASHCPTCFPLVTVHDASCILHILSLRRVHEFGEKAYIFYTFRLRNMYEILENHAKLIPVE